MGDNGNAQIRQKNEIKEQIIGKLERYFGKTLGDATDRQLYMATAMTVRDRIMDRWTQTEQARNGTDRRKRLYYLSFEFLIGRMLSDNLMSLGQRALYQEALSELGLDLTAIEDTEADAGLGNGGLGRLAACFMNSLATLDYPAYGCGIRYEYGLFKQKIVDGYQIELPDPWLEDGCVWEIARPEEQVEVYFGGTVDSYTEDGRMKFYVKDASTVIALPYDMPAPGFGTDTVNTLRLWSARSPKQLDLSQFSHGNYTKAVEEKELAEVLSKILYPEDKHIEGKVLRLRQQYFFTSATIQWIIREYKAGGGDLRRLHDYTQIHINDTHPAIGIPELMRLLMDVEGFGWDEAWEVTTKTFAYTNHTIMSEALEKWTVAAMRQQLPRICMIIEEINRRLTEDLTARFGGDRGKIDYMAVIAYDYINMANLCVVGSHSVNGVSALHAEILQKDLFKDYYGIMPYKFSGITNGVTHRRWLLGANPRLAALIQDAIGDGFIREPEKLTDLAAFAKDSAFQEQFAKIKHDNKAALSRYIFAESGILADPGALFDTQAKRLHEYKRQLMNVLHILYLYHQILENPSFAFPPRVFLFAAKASPGY
ncbi:MAG: glycogen/starch/alpha-glucan family phosphorylase, partial [Clostridiales bacterium]|nr:glycogen/starch/alpha-glucan family phosphorylase [Clostridiales bacterium]